MRKDRNGSITVEAAIAVPIFFFGILVFLYLFKVILFQMEFQAGINNTANELSQLAYLKETSSASKKDWNSKIGNQLAIDYEVKRYFPNYQEFHNILKYPMYYGSSSFLNTEGEIDIVGRYVLEIPVPLFHLYPTTVVQRVKTKGFVGSTELLKNPDNKDGVKKEDQTYVYITETGKVYHKTLDCSSLKLKIMTCTYREIKWKRNASGGKYKSCKKCSGKLTDSTMVYYCEDGDAYHRDIGCSGLKRTIKKVLLSEVKDRMRPCKRCAE